MVFLLSARNFRGCERARRVSCIPERFVRSQGRTQPRGETWRTRGQRLVACTCPRDITQPRPTRSYLVPHACMHACRVGLHFPLLANAARSSIEPRQRAAPFPPWRRRGYSGQRAGDQGPRADFPSNFTRQYRDRRNRARLCMDFRCRARIWTSDAVLTVAFQAHLPAPSFFRLSVNELRDVHFLSDDGSGRQRAKNPNSRRIARGSLA